MTTPTTCDPTSSSLRAIRRAILAAAALPLLAVLNGCAAPGGSSGAAPVATVATGGTTAGTGTEAPLPDTNPDPGPTTSGEEPAPPAVVEDRMFLITLTNLTEGQPMSPAYVAVHGGGYRAWEPGQPATEGLERLAEGGDRSVLTAESEAHGMFRDSDDPGGGLPPAQSVAVELEADPEGEVLLTVAAMLGNTNDGFVGLTGHDLDGMSVDEITDLEAWVWDAGTEANDETALTVPGPAGGGEAFNAGRDDRDFVSIHPGVVTQDDGLPTSTLRATHRFSAAAMQIRVHRIQ